MQTRTDLDLSMMPFQGSPPVRWRISDDLVPYDEAIATMEHEAAAIADGRADELVWLLEHPPLYTAGTSANATDLIEPDRFPVHQTGRGGEYTYHGPGQRVAYVMLDLNAAVRMCAPMWPRSKTGDPHARHDECQGRAARGSGRRLGEAAGKAAALRWHDGGRQDRSARHQAASLGQLSRAVAQCRSGPDAFFRYRTAGSAPMA